MIWGAEKIEKKKFEGPSPGKKNLKGLPQEKNVLKRIPQGEKIAFDIYSGPPRSLMVEPLGSFFCPLEDNCWKGFSEFYGNLPTRHLKIIWRALLSWIPGMAYSIQYLHVFWWHILDIQANANQVHCGPFLTLWDKIFLKFFCYVLPTHFWNWQHEVPEISMHEFLLHKKSKWLGKLYTLHLNINMTGATATCTVKQRYHEYYDKPVWI